MCFYHNTLSKMIYTDKNGNEYHENDILLFQKVNDAASGERCRIINIHLELVELEWIDKQITIEPLKNLCDYFSIST